MTVTSSFDVLVESYRQRGLSAEAARQAAIGRDHYSEAEARAASDGMSTLRAAEQVAERATLFEEAHRSRGLPVPGGPVQLREVYGPGEAAARVAELAVFRLGMAPVEATQYATRLMEREMTRGGSAHTVTWMNRLGEALNAQAAS